MHLKGRVSERNKTVMYALNRGENSGYFGKALVSPVDGYFVMTEQYSSEKKHWNKNKNEVAGVDPDFDNAVARLYKRMRRRATKIAKDEGREVEIDLDSDLEQLIKGKR